MISTFSEVQQSLRFYEPEEAADEGQREKNECDPR